MTLKKALIVGASGGIGQNLVQSLSKLEDWEIVGLSRRKPTFESKAQFISVDLLNQEDVQAKLRELTDSLTSSTPLFMAAPRFQVQSLKI